MKKANTTIWAILIVVIIIIGVYLLATRQTSTISIKLLSPQNYDIAPKLSVVYGYGNMAGYNASVCSLIINNTINANQYDIRIITINTINATDLQEGTYKWSIQCASFNESNISIGKMSESRILTIAK